MKTLKEMLAEARQVVPEEGPAEVHKRLASGDPLVVIDVRDPDEFRDGHLEAASNISRGFLEFRVGSAVSDQTTPVVLYCQTGLRSMLAAMKVRGMSVYSRTEPGHPMPDASTGAERRHRGLASGGNLRAAVFGVNDGLVSNASLILGVAGAAAEPGIILLSGVAGLLAGAFSMAAGEYVSVRSQREMYEYQIGLERDELEAYPEEEAKELALIYEARGLAWAEAKRLADSMIADPERGLDTLAREELGLNTDELGSPWGAATFSFLSFAGGALLPVLPFLFGKSPGALYVSIGLTAAALFAVGSTLSLFTGRGALRGGARMLLIGGAAGALTFAIGRLLGVSLG
jgi:VIT1/CCC1 family predicted Fe2+/Mn2+ transporter/rhodanese-related sulfurtransferase